MKYIYFLVFFSSCLTFSQDQEQPEIEVIDSLYREDQFYFGMTYNILKNKPTGLSQHSLSSTINFGFLRDFPITKSRRVAIAPGIGFSYSNFKQNLVISDSSSGTSYEIMPANTNFDKNKFSFLAVEFPLELRWRNSTPQSHKFFRIYGGVKASYVFYNYSFFGSDSKSYSITNNADFNSLQYSTYLVLGYNSINIFASYGLNDFFKHPIIKDSDAKLRSLNLGLIFYIL
ncbi:porin family protein [Flavobacterium sp.]|uniref:porin family protein n=1 Tax=Flavobacterium sp. TaxID=239 RepID=UPI003D13588A